MSTTYTDYTDLTVWDDETGALGGPHHPQADAVTQVTL